MKLIVFLFITQFYSCFSYGQKDYRKSPALGIHFFSNNFKQKQNSGIAISYLAGINNNMDIVGNISGSFLDYPYKQRTSFNEKNLLLESAITLNLKLYTDKRVVTPFFTTGAGVSKYKNYYGLFLPVGIGLQANYKEEVYLLLNSQYFFGTSKNMTSHFYSSIGIAGNIIKRKRSAPKKVIPVSFRTLEKPSMDRDGDGLLDVDDRCPEMAGTVSTLGCPDTDNDGLVDIDDRCPAVFGLLRYQGCPVPDRDGDGVNDEQDSCITDPGPANNHGCPVISNIIQEKINIAAENIFFETGSARLKTESFMALEEVAKILNHYSRLRLTIEGHTDNVGTIANNKILSQARAKAVLNYLQSKGIDAGRMNAIGFGQEKPIADNVDAKGRAKNRRVEMKISE